MLNEIIIFVILWLILSFLVKKYIVRELKIHHLFACLILALIFVAVYVVVGIFVGYFAGYWGELGSVGESVVFLVSVWIMFIIARSLIETEKWRVRENVLFLSLLLVYIIYAIMLTVARIIVSAK